MKTGKRWILIPRPEIEIAMRLSRNSNFTKMFWVHKRTFSWPNMTWNGLKSNKNQQNCSGNAWILTSKECLRPNKHLPAQLETSETKNRCFPTFKQPFSTNNWLTWRDQSHLWILLSPTIWALYRMTKIPDHTIYTMIIYNITVPERMISWASNYQKLESIPQFLTT